MHPNKINISYYVFFSKVHQILKFNYKRLIQPECKIKRLQFFTTLLLLLTISSAVGQQTFRRHFIIAYDVSSPFVNAEKRTPAFRNALVNLFSNKPIVGYNECNENNLQIESQNQVPFFDPQHDEITFFHFNVASSEFDLLRRIQPTTEITDFENVFLKKKFLYWSRYKKMGASNIQSFLNEMLNIERVPSSFGNGVSMSNFVFPLVLDKMDKSKYAQEYVLILLSDFLTGSMLGNKKDFERIKDIYKISYERSFPVNSTPYFIKKHIDDLNAKYYKIDFFQYSFISTPTVGIIGYKIKPKAGNLLFSFQYYL